MAILPTDSSIVLPDALQQAAAMAFFDQVLTPPEELLEAYVRLSGVGEGPCAAEIQQVIEEVGVVAPQDYDGADAFCLEDKDVQRSARTIVELSEPAFSAIGSEKENIQQDFLARARTMLFWQEKLPEDALNQWDASAEWTALASGLGCENEFFGLVVRATSLRTQGRWATHFNMGHCWDKKFSQWQSALAENARSSLNWLDLVWQAPEKNLEWNTPRGAWKPAYKDPTQYAQEAFQKLLENCIVTFVRLGAEEKPAGLNMKLVVDALARKGFKPRPDKLAWGRLMPSVMDLRSDGMSLMLWRFRKLVSVLDDPISWLEEPARLSPAFPSLNGSAFVERLSEHTNRQAEGAGVVLANILQSIEQYGVSCREDVSDWTNSLESLRFAGRLEKSLPTASAQDASRPRM